MADTEKKKAPAKAAKAATKTAAKKSAVKAASKAAPVKKAEATHDEIARLAHRFFVERGGQHGYANQDWSRAERELREDAS